MIITTSWDDGHPMDFKLIRLLEKYNIRATFYIPLTNKENEIVSLNQIKQISNYNEIGGHTINHVYLNKLSKVQAKTEIKSCKQQLEQIIGKEVKAFCFPGGKYSKRDVELVKEAGFRFGRTTRFFNTKIRPDSFLMHTTVQSYNHNFVNLLKHSAKRLIVKDAIDCMAFLPYSNNFVNLSHHYLNKAEIQVFHLWGHSWELEKFNLWNQLEELFAIFNETPNVTFMNNSECWDFFSKSINYE
jgi:peptidoglycan-N-acetylglucosamine deacetylase